MDDLNVVQLIKGLARSASNLLKDAEKFSVLSHKGELMFTMLDS